MSRNIEEPVTVETDDGLGSRTTHPAFAQIGANRLSGHSVLYGSDFPHQTSIRITIARSVLHRNLSNDWYFGGEQLVSVDLSEAQWATFVSSMNVSDGVPCTLTRLGNQGVPGLTLSNKTDKFKAEADKTLAKAVADLEALSADIDNLGLSKVKAAALKERLRSAHMQIVSNLPFVAEQFAEHVEDSVEKAKVEINAYMTSVVQRAGLNSLQANMPLQIETKSD